MTTDLGRVLTDQALVATLPEPVPVSAHTGDGPSRVVPEDVRAARWASVDWQERMAVSDLDIEAALYGNVPGGSSVWVWLPQLDGWTPHPTAYDVMRSAIAAVDKYRANLAARDSDASLAEDAKRLSPEGVAARAEGIAKDMSHD